MRLVKLHQVAEINPSVPTDLRSADDLRISFVEMSSVSEQGRITHWTTEPISKVLGRYRYFQRGDVLFAKITPCMENGKVAVAAGIPTDVGFGSTEFHVLRPSDHIDSRYLFYLVWRDSFRKKAERSMTGSAGQKRVPAAYLEEVEVPLPPIEEQRRIAAILDKADAIRRKRREAIALTEELLRSTFLEIFGDIPAKQSRWPWGTPGPYVEMASGKSPKGVMSTAVTDTPIYGGNGVSGYATESLYSDPVVIVGRVGQQCGVTHLTEGPCWVTDNAIVVRVTNRERLDPVYLASAFQSAPIRQTVERLDLPFINQDMLRNQPIPLPPVAIQRRFAELRRKTLARKSQMAAAEQEADALFESLTHQAFTGQL